MPELPNDDADLAEHARKAADAIRALNHLTRATTAAPEVYEVLGSLTELGHRLPQLFDQLGNGLRRSLDEHNVVDDKRDPADSIEMAHAALHEAAGHARDLGWFLEQAQNAVSHQGYRPDAPPAARPLDRGHAVLSPSIHPNAPETAMGQPWQRPYDAPRHRPQPEPPGLEGP